MVNNKADDDVRCFIKKIYFKRSEASQTHFVSKQKVSAPPSSSRPDEKIPSFLHAGLVKKKTG
jgi:hypothetical protein